MLSRFTAQTMRSVADDPTKLLMLRKALESREAKIQHEFHLLGEWDHCTVFEASDNFRAYYATLGQELTDAVERAAASNWARPIGGVALQAS